MFPNLDSVDEIYEKRVFDLRMWSPDHIYPIEWLNNFNNEELIMAKLLLKNFLFFSNKVTDSLLLSSIHSISNIIPSNKRRLRWNGFLNTCYISYVTGETPNPTDSGYIFARKLRQNMDFDSDRIVSPEEIQRLYSNGNTSPVIFVDDFVGSGNQFITMWKKKSQSSSLFHSLEFYMTRPTSIERRIYLCCSLATSAGIERIQKECKGVTVCAGSILSKSYNILDNQYFYNTPEDHEKVVQFVKEKSHYLGYGDCGGNIGDWRGFEKLGLAVAFEHGTPDATLPIFYHTDREWHPLVKKS